MDRSDDGWWTPAEPVPGGEVDYGYLLDDDARPRPTRARGASRRVRTAVRARSTSARLDRPTLTGQASSSPARSSTSCTSVRSRLRARSTPRPGRLDHLRRPRRRAGRADAGQLLRRHPQLGLRRRRLVHGRRDVRRPGGVPALRRRLPPGGPRRRPGRRPQPPRSVRQLPAAVRALPQDRPQHLGRPGQPRRRGLGARCGATSSTTSGCGSRTTTSTGCGSTPCTRSRTPRPCTCSRRSRPRWHALSARLGRPLTLIAESDLNDPRLVTPRDEGGYGLDAQWSDDFHHALHVALTGETHGYYADFEPLAALAKVCERGFFHDGTWSSFRERDHGAPIDTDTTPTWRLVVCSQNHDQIGNRAAGDRLTDALDDDQLACAALVTLVLARSRPMLFQGEEWAASTPFQFFTSHTDPERRPSHVRGPARPSSRGTAGTRRSCPTRRTRRRTTAPSSTGPSRPRRAAGGCCDVYRRLIALRREHADLTEPSFDSTSCTADEDTGVLHDAPRIAHGARELR